MVASNLTLPPAAVRDWAIKDLVSRDPLPADLDERQLAAAARREAAIKRLSRPAKLALVKTSPL
jgi:hypothetical protein